MFHSALPRHLRCFALKIMPIDPKPIWLTDGLRSVTAQDAFVISGRTDAERS
jgi:hypothetical protein